MSDRKTERLINLTLALLATKRYLKKSEILNNVMGYEGTQEAKERMFERDKDDLRSLGIEIEVGDLDVFFEDEPGYRIPQKSYELNIPDLTSRELALLSIASSLWNDSILAPNAQSGIRKLQSLGIPATLEFEFRMKYRFDNPSQLLEQIEKAILDKSQIEFSYDSSSLKNRHLEPYRIVFWNGFWYLIGRDIDRNGIRLFKVSRFLGSINVSKKKNEFEIPADFAVTDHLPTSEVQIIRSAKVEIRKDAGLLLRQRGELIFEGDEFDRYQINYENERIFLRELIWHGANVRILEPENLQRDLISLIEEVLL
ncbi:MAG: WYL domain-containing protein [Actinomycetes bacterium]